MKFSIPTNREIAAKAYELILADFSVYDSVEEIARKIGTNPVKLKHLFKRYYQVSVFDFSRRMRMEKAKELLLQTDYTLQCIAEEVGYTEGNNFQVAFKNVVGCTPGEWRRQNLKNE